VDLVVPTGRVVALLGPNGAGKTTLLRVASGTLAARQGTIRADGADVTLMPFDERARQGICHVTEGRSIFRALSVRDNLRLFATDPAHLDRAMTTFPVLGTRLNQIAGTMSGGEQQMLALVRAYASNARLVLLDEVSMGLAPLVIDEIFAFLSTLAESGTTLLIVEQYVGRVLAIADYAYVLSKGSIAFAGQAAELVGVDVAAHYFGAAAS
jgi:branched-chain amino acid transport system ATP-binding protein